MQDTIFDIRNTTDKRRIPLTILNILVALHLSRALYKSTLFMQNKPNLLDTQMNATSFVTKDYNNKLRTTNNELLCKTNPIKPHPNLSVKLFPLGDGQAIDPEDSKVFQAFIVA